MKWSNIFDKLTGKATENANKWHFSTSIMCNGCIAKIKPVLDEAQGIASWEVNLSSPQRILTVVSNGITQEELLSLVRGAGFTIEAI